MQTLQTLRRESEQQRFIGANISEDGKLTCSLKPRWTDPNWRLQVVFATMSLVFGVLFVYYAIKYGESFTESSTEQLAHSENPLDSPFYVSKIQWCAHMETDFNTTYCINSPYISFHICACIVFVESDLLPDALEYTSIQSSIDNANETMVDYYVSMIQRVGRANRNMTFNITGPALNFNSFRTDTGTQVACDDDLEMGMFSIDAMYVLCNND